MGDGICDEAAEAGDFCGRTQGDIRGDRNRGVVVNETEYGGGISDNDGVGRGEGVMVVGTGSHRAHHAESKSGKHNYH